LKYTDISEISVYHTYLLYHQFENFNRLVIIMLELCNIYIYAI